MADHPDAEAPTLSPLAIATRAALGVELAGATPGRSLVTAQDGSDEVSGPEILRSNHHQIARYAALGKKNIEIALITGYSAGYIGGIIKTPAMAELIAHYRAEQDEIFVNVAHRMKDLGIVAMEELLARVTDSPKDWTRKDLMELIELMFGKGGAAKAAGLTPKDPKEGGIPQIQVTFVGASPTPGPSEANIIDVTPKAVP